MTAPTPHRRTSWHNAACCPTCAASWFTATMPTSFPRRTLSTRWPMAGSTLPSCGVRRPAITRCDRDGPCSCIGRDFAGYNLGLADVVRGRDGGEARRPCVVAVLNEALQRNKAGIEAILAEYGVPVQPGADAVSDSDSHSFSRLLASRREPKTAAVASRTSASVTRASEYVGGDHAIRPAGDGRRRPRCHARTVSGRTNHGARQRAINTCPLVLG